jgi:hypothetical protein
MNKKDRREFLKKAAAGTLGIGAILSGLASEDKVFAKLLSKYSKTHLDTLMTKLRSGKITDVTGKSLIRNFHDLEGLVAGNAELDRIVNSVIDYFESLDTSIASKDSAGLFTLPESISNMIVGGYLAAADVLNSGGLTVTQVSDGSLRLSNWVQTLETGFFQDYHNTLQRELQADAGLRNLVSSGKTALQTVLSQLDNSPQSLRIRCRIGNRRVPCWLWFLIVIIIIIICLA